MSDEDALLAAIAAHPEEDTPRLAYADWLDEHGRPIRAEFIRVQVEVARVETLPRIDLNRHVDLFRRQEELLANHRPELLGPLAAIARGAKIEFERGFVSELWLRCSPFLRHRRLLAAARPLPRILIRDVTARVRNLLGYQLEDRAWEPDARLVSSIGTIPHRTADRRSEEQRGPELEPVPFRPLSWPRLTELDLSGCRLGDVNTRTLLQADCLPVLADLDLSANYLTDDAVSSLLDTPLPRQLKRLILGGNPISDRGAIELAERWPRGKADQLETLNLKYTQIGTPGHQALTARFAGRVELF